DLDVLTVNNASLGSILEHSKEPNVSIIRDLNRPYRDIAGLIIIKGNIAPNGAIVKLAALPEDRYKFSGIATVFQGEDEAIQGLADGKIKSGDVVILAGLGPKGGPSTVFACSFAAALNGAGLSGDVAVVTDGELSGLNRGLIV